MPDKMADRRVAPRYPLILRVELVEFPAGAKISARTSDLSRDRLLRGHSAAVPFGHRGPRQAHTGE